MEKNSPHLFLVDPRADFEKVRYRWPAYKAALFSVLGECEVVFIRNQHKLKTVLSPKKLRTLKSIFIVGDDTTLHHVVNVLMALKIKTIPNIGICATSGFNQGFLNSFSPRHWKTKDRIALCVGMAKKRKATKVDLGVMEYNGSKRYFLNMASYGVSGMIMDRLPKSIITVHSGLAYGLTVLDAMSRYKAPRVSIEEGKKMILKNRSIFNLFIGNGSHGANGMKICPQGKLDDGKLHLLVLPNDNFSDLIMDIPKLWLEGQEFFTAITKDVTKVLLTQMKGNKGTACLELDGVPVKNILKDMPKGKTVGFSIQKKALAVYLF